jgi:hypothetical protein
VAYLVGQDGWQGGATPAVRDLRAWLAERLPGHMLPEAVVFLDRLPVSQAGKIDRARLPAPPASRPELGLSYVAPATDTQRRLAGIWARVLGLDLVGIHDNFFDLGGNSVRLLAVLTALAASDDSTGDGGAGGVDGASGATLVDLFRYPSIAELAAWLDQQCGQERGGQERGGQEPERDAAARHGRSRRNVLNSRLERAQAARQRAEITGCAQEKGAQEKGDVT